VFSSVDELAAARGPADWFSTTGAELLAILPDEYDMLLDVAGPESLWIKATGREVGAAESRTIDMRYRAAQHIRFADGTHQRSWASWTIAGLHREIGQVTVEQMLPLSLGVRGVAVIRQPCTHTAFALARIDPAVLRPIRSAAIGVPARIPGHCAWRTNLADPTRRPGPGENAGRLLVAECGSVVRHIGTPPH
jgi:hypothetical protein